MTSTSKDSFDDVKFMKELVHLRDTQEAIQSLSAWCLKNKKSAYKIARCWVKVIKKVKTEQKLPLYYLVNDVVQHSKRKNYNEVIERFQSVLKEAMPHLKDENISPKVRRVLDIWGERQVFNDKFLKELIAILESGKKKDIDDIVNTFQPNQLCTQIKIMKALEDDTEYKLKTLSDSDVNLIDFDENSLRQKLTDRQHGTDFYGEVEDSRKKLEQYIKAVDREITKRRQVKDLLEQAKKYYDSLYEEANIVANAYTAFGKKVKTVEKKIDAKIEIEATSSKSVASLLSDADLSPMPSPDFDAPSPVSDEDFDTSIKLPDDGDTTPTYTSGGQETPPLSTVRGPNTAEYKGEQMSISEYLTKLAGQDQPSSATGNGRSNNGFFYADDSSYYADPPPATSWPAPKPEYQQNEHEDPVPDWVVQTEDDEPPELSRLQYKGHGNTLVEVKTDGRNSSAINDVDMEVVGSEDEIEHIPNHELSLQERLSNLAGVQLPIPGLSPPHDYDQPPQQHQQPPQKEHQQPPPHVIHQDHHRPVVQQQVAPRPFFAERPPGPPRGPMRGPRPNFRGSPGGHRGGFGPRRPFRGRGGNFRGGGPRPRW